MGKNGNIRVTLPPLDQRALSIFSQAALKKLHKSEPILNSTDRWQGGFLVSNSADNFDESINNPLRSKRDIVAKNNYNLISENSAGTLIGSLMRYMKKTIQQFKNKTNTKP